MEPDPLWKRTRSGSRDSQPNSVRTCKAGARVEWKSRSGLFFSVAIGCFEVPQQPLESCLVTIVLFPSPKIPNMP